MELYSNAEDCNKIAKILYDKLKGKIEFYGSTYQEVVSGKYHSLSFEKYDSYDEYRKDELVFSYKFCENGFLRITIGDCIYKKSFGHKLAVLSDFYEVLSKIYGEPTVFYTLKDDDEKTLNLQWSFSQKEEDIEKLKNGMAFDDAKIDELIIFGLEKNSSDFYKLSDITKNNLSRSVGLPFDMIYLVDENIDDFVKYKQGKKMSIPSEVRIDGYPIATPEEMDKKIERLEDGNTLRLIKRLFKKKDDQ